VALTPRSGRAPRGERPYGKAPSTTSLVLRYAGGHGEPQSQHTLRRAQSFERTFTEISQFLKPFAPLFRRSQSRHSLERYVTGLLTDLDRKNCDTIAAALAGTSTERLQHLLTDADWDSLKLDGARVRSLSQKSPEGGILLVLDDTSFPKQGKSSVGVARQYCGALGKRANCQVVVSAHHVADEPESSRPLHWPLCAQLYLPESWTRDRRRRERAMCPRRCTLGANLR
jgi:SRSO17 transposase